MSFKVTLIGDKLDLADELAEEFEAQAKEAVSEAADLLLHEVQRNLRLRVGTRKTVAPIGQPPEFDTGALLASFRKIAPRVKGRVASSGIRSNHPGANREEFGKTDVRGIRTFPHPYVAPAMAVVDEPVNALLQERLAG